MSSIRPRPSSALVPYTTLGQSASRPPSLDAPQGTLGLAQTALVLADLTTSCRGQFWGSRNHADISELVGGAAQKLVQFARTSAFCKNSCAQRPHLTPRTGPGPGSPRAPRTTSRGASQSGVPGARRRVRHGGRPGARRGTSGAHHADPGRGLVAARRADGTRLGRPGCATAVGLLVPGGHAGRQGRAGARGARSACWCRAARCQAGTRLRPATRPPALPATPDYRLRPSRTSATQARATWKSLSLVPATTVTGRASRRG